MQACDIKQVSGDSLLKITRGREEKRDKEKREKGSYSSAAEDLSSGNFPLMTMRADEQSVQLSSFRHLNIILELIMQQKLIH